MVFAQICLFNRLKLCLYFLILQFYLIQLPFIKWDHIFSITLELIGHTFDLFYPFQQIILSCISTFYYLLILAILFQNNMIIMLQLWYLLLQRLYFYGFLFKELFHFIELIDFYLTDLINLLELIDSLFTDYFIFIFFIKRLRAFLWIRWVRRCNIVLRLYTIWRFYLMGWFVFCIVVLLDIENLYLPSRACK